MNEYEQRKQDVIDIESQTDPVEMKRPEDDEEI